MRKMLAISAILFSLLGASAPAHAFLPMLIMMGSGKGMMGHGDHGASPTPAGQGHAHEQPTPAAEESKPSATPKLESSTSHCQQDPSKGDTP